MYYNTCIYCFVCYSVTSVDHDVSHDVIPATPPPEDMDTSHINGIGIITYKYMLYCNCKSHTVCVSK